MVKTSLTDFPIFSRTIKLDYDRIQSDEAQLRRECRELEKTMALTKHDLKEVLAVTVTFSLDNSLQK